MNPGPGLLIGGSMLLDGPAGTLRLLGCGTHLVLDATDVRWGPVARRCFRRREWSWLRSLARALEAQRLRVDVESGGRTLLSIGSGCRGGLLSWLLGGAPIARRAHP